MIELTRENIYKISPVAKDFIVQGLLDNEKELDDSSIVGIRKQYFLSQIAHESDGFKTTIEYSSGEEYEGREDLGNTEDGDGIKFKGRGLIQLTGRSNYDLYGKLLNVDLVNNPDKAAQFPYALLTAVEFWMKHNLNTFADQRNFDMVTRRINGGLNGLSSRLAYLSKIKQLCIGENNDS